MIRRLAVALLAMAAACSQSDAGTPIRLDGSPRYPDDQGVATTITRTMITLDGERSYRVSDQLRSFSTSTLDLEPMRKRQGQYVLVGVDDGAVVWMAAVAGVVIVDDGPSVYYTGTIAAQRGRDLVFEDGTVLRLDRGVDAPAPASFVRVRIDATRHVVVDVK